VARQNQWKDFMLPVKTEWAEMSRAAHRNHASVRDAEYRVAGQHEYAHVQDAEFRVAGH
jgi:hypothetical protein